jgi:hypothetical protein
VCGSGGSAERGLTRDNLGVDGRTPGREVGEDQANRRPVVLLADVLAPNLHRIACDCGPAAMESSDMPCIVTDRRARRPTRSTCQIAQPVGRARHDEVVAEPRRMGLPFTGNVPSAPYSRSAPTFLARPPAERPWPVRSAARWSLAAHGGRPTGRDMGAGTLSRSIGVKATINPHDMLAHRTLRKCTSA